MATLADWDETLWADIEELDIGEFSPVLRVMSDWMDYELDPRTVVGILREVVWADMEKPVVVGSAGDLITGIPQLLRAYIEGHEVVRTVRLTPPQSAISCVQ